MSSSRGSNAVCFRPPSYTLSPSFRSGRRRKPPAKRFRQGPPAQSWTGSPILFRISGRPSESGHLAVGIPTRTSPPIAAHYVSL